MPNDDVVGQLVSTAYPLFDYVFTDTDGTKMRVQVVARFRGVERSYDTESRHFDRPSQYVVLVTHHDGKELDDSRKYFRIIPSEEMAIDKEMLLMTIRESR